MPFRPLPGRLAPDRRLPPIRPPASRRGRHSCESPPLFTPIYQGDPAGGELVRHDPECEGNAVTAAANGVQALRLAVGRLVDLARGPLATRPEIA